MPKNNFLEDQAKEDTEQKIVLPKHHGWAWSLLIILILAIGGAVLIYVQRNAKTNIAPMVSDFASCRTAGGEILETYPEQCRFNNQSFTNPDQKVVEEEEPEVAEEPEPQLKAFSDTANQFSFSYPETLTQTEADVSTPYTNSPVDITSQIFSHSIPVEYCAASGTCIPNTTDFSISFTVVNSSVATISASPKMAGIADITFGTNKFKYLEQGAEGEGIVYYFISLPSGKSLMIAQKFIDETVVISYQNADGFIKKADQDKLAEQILGSLKFETTN